MRTFILTALIILCSGIGFSSSKTKLKVIYFHGKHRCFTCNAIESNTKKTLNEYFRKEIEKGTIVFQIINIDESTNKSIASEYGVYGSSLFLVQIINGKENRNNITNFAFTNARDETKFKEELRIIIMAYL